MTLSPSCVTFAPSSSLKSTQGALSAVDPSLDRLTGVER